MKNINKRVVIVAPVHIWNDVRVFKKEALTLLGEGYEVILIARVNNNCEKSGIKIISPAGSHRNRFLRFFSLPLVAIQALKYRGMVYHFHNPDTLPIAVLVKLLGHRVVYDTHEDFTKKILVRNWLPKYARKLVAYMVGKAERLTAGFVDRCIVTQENVARRLGKNSILIGNPPRFDEALLRKVEVEAESIKVSNEYDVFRLVYIGGVSFSRGLKEMVEALNILNNKISCRLWLIGPADKKELMLAQDLKGWAFVDYLPRMPQEKAFAYVYLADVGLIYINDVGDHSETDPNKIYEYMLFKKPFIASDFSKWRKKLGCYKAGIFITPGSALILSDTVEYLFELGENEREKMGENGYCYVLKNNWDVESAKLITLYQDLFVDKS
ncbi:glycosyltransferase [Vreelandella janggokensis]|uniref:glycosyltransferase n=1 Tax=Vreelandella janggokensis TaxID=370767 RepID=UPI002859FFED|nr:glycosyltransferase [Halomonas janggokensis]MDR5886708.1 glycosyltransferase [Halomonas janggokensis]